MGVGVGGWGCWWWWWVVCGFKSLKLYRTYTASSPHSTLLVEGTLQASMDRNCVVTGELFPFEFRADFSTFIKVGGSKCYGLDGECAGLRGRCFVALARAWG